MMFRQVWLMFVAIGATGQVLAQETAPAEPAAPRAATPAQPPADAKPASEAPVAATPAAKADSLTEGELDADKIMAMQKAGYQIKNENGRILLCRQDLQTGSRLRKKTSCMTAREWEQLQEDTKLQLKAIERRPRMANQ
ncbi:hypothetical protein [Peristeroidobacter agariperforans]|uniref:hypothetical protein n=1 Tax=Peristeroidobacter agariperforans TaxID=268404 RepID=UPI00101D41DD|nr:hypothetical protein [Peristeroidobacter agariperforans]